MRHLAVLFTNYGPYHLARLEGLYHQTQRLGWTVSAIELARSEADYAWKASVEHLPYPFFTVCSKPLQSVKLPELVSQVYRQLNQVQPDVLAIAGYANPGMLAALSWTVSHRKAAILISATKEDDTARQTWQEWLKRGLLTQYRAALVGGQPQKRYLLRLGMPEERIFTGYNVVGNATFHPDRIGSLPNPVGQPFFLSVNRFVPKKNLLRLLMAYADYCEHAGDQAWHLVLCGDGVERSKIEQKIQALNLTAQVHLPGFLQQEALLPYYAHAGCFVHASLQEQWGLVVNEAMAAGLPVLLSRTCGCYEDLLMEGVNGWGFDPNQVEPLTQLMLKMSQGDARSMGQAALAHIQKFSPDYFAQELVGAAQTALCGSTKDVFQAVGGRSKS
ncbi:glycosyltransferase family 4 protein [Pseudanabaenaceae cyanobacterium LEGE 13415]|nr:glycosyltransferase family 4 protein [Pseudanabaenaceae cyanobacterium LEGE 13415]